MSRNFLKLAQNLLFFVRFPFERGTSGFDFILKIFNNLNIIQIESKILQISQKSLVIKNTSGLKHYFRFKND